jgi:hypothetical protein
MHENRLATIKQIREWDIKKTMLAGACDTTPQRISDFLKQRQLPAAIEDRIISAVSDMVFVWQVFQPYQIPLTNPRLLQAALEDARITAHNRETGSLERQIEQALSAM